MEVVYTGRSTEGRYVQISLDWDEFAPWGEPVELPDEIAHRLLTERPDEWSTPKPPKARKANSEE